MCAILDTCKRNYPVIKKVISMCAILDTCKRNYPAIRVFNTINKNLVL